MDLAASLFLFSRSHCEVSKMVRFPQQAVHFILQRPPVDWLSPISLDARWFTEAAANDSLEQHTQNCRV